MAYKPSCQGLSQPMSPTTLSKTMCEMPVKPNNTAHSGLTLLNPIPHQSQHTDAQPHDRPIRHVHTVVLVVYKAKPQHVQVTCPSSHPFRYQRCHQHPCRCMGNQHGCLGRCALVKVAVQLHLVRHIEQFGFGKIIAKQLHAYGQALLAEARWHADARQACQVQ